MASVLIKMFIGFLVVYIYMICYGASSSEFFNDRILQRAKRSEESSSSNALSNLNIRKKRNVNINAEHLVGIKSFYNEPELFYDHEEIPNVKSLSYTNVNLSLKVEPSTGPVIELCQDLQKKLGRSSSDFNQCAILKARPITLCLDCITSYNETLYIYERLMEVHEGGRSCKDEFLNKDKLQVIQVLYSNVWNLWDQAHCNSCYVQQDSKTGKSNFSLFSDMTATFMLALSQVTECLNNASINFFMSNKDSNSTCVRCDPLYRNLSSIYKSIVMNQNSDIHSTGVCMDITDAMNTTRQRWSNEFKCRHFDTKFGYPVILLTVSIGIVPFLFYLAAKILASVEDIKLILPKRKSFVLDSARLQM